jgi:ABC-2 type transport system ATP-binding protein
VEVTGTGDLLSAVMSVLARHQIVARQLRVEQANLEDAFLELIGRRTCGTANGASTANAASTVQGEE